MRSPSPSHLPELTSTCSPSLQVWPPGWAAVTPPPPPLSAVLDNGLPRPEFPQALPRSFPWARAAGCLSSEPPSQELAGDSQQSCLLGCSPAASSNLRSPNAKSQLGITSRALGSISGPSVTFLTQDGPLRRPHRHLAPWPPQPRSLRVDSGQQATR